MEVGDARLFDEAARLEKCEVAVEGRALLGELGEDETGAARGELRRRSLQEKRANSVTTVTRSDGDEVQSAGARGTCVFAEHGDGRHAAVHIGRKAPLLVARRERGSLQLLQQCLELRRGGHRIAQEPACGVEIVLAEWPDARGMHDVEVEREGERESLAPPSHDQM